MRAQDSDGFFLVEVVVAAAIFIIVTLATLALTDAATKESGQDRLRATGVSVAHANLARLHHLATNDVQGSFDQTSPVTKDGITYSVRSQGAVVGDSSSTSQCTVNNSGAQYFELTSTVSNPQMQRPVVFKTLFAPSVAKLSAANGSMTVRLLNAANNDPAKISSDAIPAGISVSISGPESHSATTNSAGCATFGLIKAGTYTVSLDTSAYTTPYVNGDGATKVTARATVTRGRLRLVPLQYDKQASVSVKFDTATVANGASVAAPYRNAALTSGSASNPRVFTTGAGGALCSPNSTSCVFASKLFPFSAGYGVYAGACQGNDPTNYNPNYFVANSAHAATSPGGTTAVTVRVPTFKITGFQRSSGSGSKVNVSAGHIKIAPDSSDQMAGCPTTPLTSAIPSSGQSAGTALIAVPFGNWALCYDDGNGKRTTTSLVIKSRNPVILSNPTATDSGSC